MGNLKKKTAEKNRQAQAEKAAEVHASQEEVRTSERETPAPVIQCRCFFISI